MKNALIFEGPGFSDQADLVHNLELRGYKVLLRRAGFEKGSLQLPEVKSADLILLRGPWTASPEDRLLARILADRLRESLDLVLKAPAAKKPALVGIGRGALILCFLGFMDAKVFSRLQWRGAFHGKGPWVRAKFSRSEIIFNALVQGRVLPDMSNESGFKPWVEVDGEAAGWSQGERLFVSFVDIFAYAERTQLADFGYTDLLHIPTQALVLDAFLDHERASTSGES